MPRRRGRRRGRGRGRRSQPSSGSETSDHEISRRRSHSSDDELPPKRRRMEDKSWPPSTRSESRRHRLLGENEGSGRIYIINDEAFADRMAALKTKRRKKEASQLKPEKVDFHIERNREDHHTDEYENDSLIVRRGQEFKVSVTFDRPFDSKQDKLVLQLTYGSRPQESKKSLIRIKEVEQLSTSSWGMRIEKTSTSGKTASLVVMSPADAFVGKYSVYVETKTNKSESEQDYLTYRKKFDETFIVLFNAWCKDDTVYMDNEEHRFEYVLNDHGRIWVGSARRNEGIPWYFGQFEDVSLPTCLDLLDIAEVASSARGNPIRVCRVISQMANHNDRDGGVLYGRWTETYPKNSTRPTEWTGSVAILKKFARKHREVRYGQCWVFSGLVTTLLRAIGIPTRSVTNFESAHDNDASMTIDFHFDKEGESLDYLNDSVWNFHVWNESYFTRPDLPSGHDGWQAHDATPQETSEGVFRCGPCPVKAIKNGEVYIPYDGGFIFGEVNGDRVYWEVDDDGEMTVTYIGKSSIGKCISTKAVGSKNREDLTKYYKFKEGSSEERKVVKQANKFSSRKDEHIYSKPSSHDVTFEVIEPDENLAIGDDVEIKLVLTNTYKGPRTINVAMIVKLAFYTGIVARDLDNLKKEVTLAGKEQKTVVLSVPAADYLKKSSADFSIKVFYKAKVKETGQVFHDMDIVEFKKPDVLFSLQDKIVEDESFELTLYFTNPLSVKLTNCTFNIESSRHVSPDTSTKYLKHPVKPKEEASVVVKLQAARRGGRSVNVSFNSDQLSGVRGEIEFKVVT